MSTCVGEESERESEVLCGKEKRAESREWCEKNYEVRRKEKEKEEGRRRSLAGRR